MSIIKQYFNYQTKYENEYGNRTIVLMQVGSFFEAYSTKDKGFDLHKLSDLLNLICTRRDKSILEVSMKNPEMLGFPTLALQKYLKILIDNNYTIVLIEQVTPPPNPQRKVTNIYSAGTFIEEQHSPDSNNIVSIYIEEEKQIDGSYLLAIGLSSIDLSTGKNYIYETYSVKGDEKYSLDEATRFIKMYSPKEILINVEELNYISKEKLLLYLELENEKYLYNKDFLKIHKKKSYQKEFLQKIFPNYGLLSVFEYLDIEKNCYSIISYIILLNFAYKHNSEIINNIDKPICHNTTKNLILGNNAILQLNILKNDSLLSTNQNKKYQSLFDVVNNTSTSIGRRYLKNMLLNPILDINILQKRYDLIEVIIKNKYINSIEDNLKDIADIERLHRKLSLKILHPSEFYNLHTSYENINLLFKFIESNELKDILPNDLNNFNNFMDECKNIFVLDEMNKYNLNDITGSFFVKGYYSEIDEIQDEINDSLNFMENLRIKLEIYISDNHIKKKKNDNSKLHLNYNDRDGYFFSLTKLRAKSLNEELKKIDCIKIGKNTININDFEFKDLPKGNTKIFLEEMNNKSEQIVLLREKIKSMVKDKYVKILEKFYNEYKNLFKIITNFISEIDFLKSGAKTAFKYNYSKPIISKKDKAFIKCKNIRHPIVERIQTDTEYVPNDITIGMNNIDGILLYGLNSSGKTVLMKAVGLTVILAQCGLYVPCKKLVFSPYESLYARITGNDNIFKGLSSFALEMTELRAILTRSNNNTLVIGDEICRGTEQTSGTSIVAATIKQLSDKKSSFIFASHLHKVPELQIIKELENIKCFHLIVNYDEKTDNLVFNRKLKEGSGPNVYGLTVAKYLIDDNEFIKLAESIKKNLMNESENLINDKTSRYNKNLYVYECKICKETELLDTHHINFQKDCFDGFVKEKEYIGKNFNCNLVVLCKDCHQKVHSNKIKIKGYKETSNGKELDYKIYSKGK